MVVGGGDEGRDGSGVDGGGAPVISDDIGGVQRKLRGEGVPVVVMAVFESVGVELGEAAALRRSGGSGVLRLVDSGGLGDETRSQNKARGDGVQKKGVWGLRLAYR